MTQEVERATNITVLGAGAWGTALAISAARHSPKVLLWARDAAQVADMNGVGIELKKCAHGAAKNGDAPGEKRKICDFCRAVWLTFARLWKQGGLKFTRSPKINSAHF